MSRQRRDADDFRRDMAARQHTTPGDIERKERIEANAREALRRLKSNQTYEDWRMVGHQMMVVTEEVMNEQGLVEWDADNKKLVREFTQRFETWERSVGSNAKPISKQERWALRQLMTDPKYHSFYMTELLGPEQRKTNHPNKIIEKYNRKYPDPTKPKKEPRKPSPVLSPALQERDARIHELEARNTELQEEVKAALEAPAAAAGGDVVGYALDLVQRMTDEQRAEFIEAVSNVYNDDRPLTAPKPAKKAKRTPKKAKRAGGVVIIPNL